MICITTRLISPAPKSSCKTLVHTCILLTVLSSYGGANIIMLFFFKWCRPERFLEDHSDHETYKPRDKYAYIPFGCGSHKCVGYKFAEEEAIFALVKFMQRFEIRLDPEHHKGDLHLLNAITLVPKGGIWLKVHRRE